MNSQSYASTPFWDFVQSYDTSQGPGRGVDHNNDNAPPFPHLFGGGFPFGGPAHHGPPPGPHGAGFGRGGHGHGRRGRHGPPGHHYQYQHQHQHHESRDGDNNDYCSTDSEHGAATEKSNDTPVTMRDDDGDENIDAATPAAVPDPAEVAPETGDSPPRPPRGFGGRGRGRCGRGGFRHDRRGPHRGPDCFAHPHPHPPPPFHGGFDFGNMMRGMMQNMRDGFATTGAAATTNNGTNTTNDPQAFSPPVDVFATEHAYVVHVALPGARKDDIGLGWDADRRALTISGVVHRPGDEAFLQTLVSGERRVGLFERSVALPPPGSPDRDDVDDVAITAKMDDGVLIVTVPKLDKEWTEIRKVDIE